MHDGGRRRPSDCGGEQPELSTTVDFCPRGLYQPLDGADRLDPEPFAVAVDVVNDHRGGHLYSTLRSSSAAVGGFIRPLQLTDLALEVGQPLRVVGRCARTNAAVDLGLTDPEPRGGAQSWSAARLIAPRADYVSTPGEY